jgi:hypothetical protein
MSQQQLWLSLASVIVPTVAVLVAALINHRATARANDALTQRIDRVEDRVGGVRDALTTRTDVIGRELSVVLRDVAFLRMVTETTLPRSPARAQESRAWGVTPVGKVVLITVLRRVC